MSDVVNLKPKPLRKSDTLGGNYPDAYILQMCTWWRVARAEQQKAWAEDNLATGWGTLPDRDIPHVKTDQLHLMKEMEGHLAELQPRTVLAAREMLGVCATILAYEGSPEDHLAQGPMLDIVRNVRLALEEIDPKMSLGKTK